MALKFSATSHAAVTEIFYYSAAKTSVGGEIVGIACIPHIKESPAVGKIGGIPFAYHIVVANEFVDVRSFFNCCEYASVEKPGACTDWKKSVIAEFGIVFVRQLIGCKHFFVRKSASRGNMYVKNFVAVFNTKSVLIIYDLFIAVCRFFKLKSAKSKSR